MDDAEDMVIINGYQDDDNDVLSSNSNNNNIHDNDLILPPQNSPSNSPNSSPNNSQGQSYGQSYGHSYGKSYAQSPTQSLNTILNPSKPPTDLLANIMSGVLTKDAFAESPTSSASSLSSSTNSSQNDNADPNSDPNSTSKNPHNCFTALLHQGHHSMSLASAAHRRLKPPEALFHYTNAYDLFAQASKVASHLHLDPLILKAVDCLVETCNRNRMGLEAVVKEEDVVEVARAVKESVKKAAEASKIDKSSSSSSSSPSPSPSAKFTPSAFGTGPVPAPNYPSSSLAESVLLRQAVRKGLRPVHIAGGNSMTASAFMDMVDTTDSESNSKPTSPSASVNGNKSEKMNEEPNPVEMMMSLEQELAQLSAELGMFESEAYVTKSSVKPKGGSNALASSFAAAAALDGSFCVVPSQDLMTMNFSPRASGLSRQKSRAFSPVPTPSGNSKSVTNLLGTLQTLTEENAKLLKENEGLRRHKAEADEAKEMVKRFKKEYEGRFEHMKMALEVYRNKYPGADNPATSIAPSLSSTSLRERDDRIVELERKLQEVIEDSSKKDVALKKYQKFYSEIKARSQRAKKNAIPLHGQQMHRASNQRYNALTAVQIQQQQQQQQQLLLQQQQQQQHNMLNDKK